MNSLHSLTHKQMRKQITKKKTITYKTTSTRTTTSRETTTISNTTKSKVTTTESSIEHVEYLEMSPEYLLTDEDNEELEKQLGVKPLKEDENQSEYEIAFRDGIFANGPKSEIVELKQIDLDNELHTEIIENCTPPENEYIQRLQKIEYGENCGNTNANIDNILYKPEISYSAKYQQINDPEYNTNVIVDTFIVIENYSYTTDEVDENKYAPECSINTKGVVISCDSNNKQMLTGTQSHRQSQEKSLVRVSIFEFSTFN